MFDKDYSCFWKAQIAQKFKRGSCSSQVQEEDNHYLPGSYHFGFHNFATAKRPSAKWFPKHQTALQKERRVRKPLLFRVPKFCKWRGTHSFFILILSKHFVLSYYSRKSLPIVYSYGPLSRPMNKWKDPIQHCAGSRRKHKSHWNYSALLFVCL